MSTFRPPPSMRQSQNLDFVSPNSPLAASASSTTTSGVPAAAAVGPPSRSSTNSSHISQISRNLSTASTATSSAYSSISERSQTSTLMSSAFSSSGLGSYGSGPRSGSVSGPSSSRSGLGMGSTSASNPAYNSHRRGFSEFTDSLSRQYPGGVSDRSKNNKSDQNTNLYLNARQSLRPLPPAPQLQPITNSSYSPTTSPTRSSSRTSPTRSAYITSSRHNSLRERSPSLVNSPPPPVTPPRQTVHRQSHDRGMSSDMAKLTLGSRTELSPTLSPRSSILRPGALTLVRNDIPGTSASNSASGAMSNSPGAVSPSYNSSHQVHHSGVVETDLTLLGRSTTGHLRTLSKLATAESAAELDFVPPTQEVTGLKGRRRLARADSPKKQTRNYGFGDRNWMDKQRQFLQAYEYLCHIGEAKEWIEDIIHKPIPAIVELEEKLRNGVTLAEIVISLNPDRHYKIFENPRLQYRHSDNIAIFFRYLDEVELPDLFRFELVDLYEKKNIPKVIYCIHALSWLLYRKGIVDFRIGNLVGQLEFEHHELEAMQKGLDKLGANMPAFGNMGADFGVEEEPEPEETEEERIERELREHEATIVDFQSQVRGALHRMKLGALMNTLWDREDWIIDLQARIRGDFSRQIVSYKMDMARFASNLQSLARGFLVRRRINRRNQIFQVLEPDILELQSIARANKARREFNKLRAQVSRGMGPAVVNLQSMIRAQKVRRDIEHLKSQLVPFQGPVRNIQAIARGFLQRKKHTATKEETAQMSSGAVEQLQSAIRGLQVRVQIANDKHDLEQQSAMIIDLQAATRAMIERGKVKKQLAHLDRFVPAFTTLQAKIRGKIARESVMSIKADLKTHVDEIRQLQSMIRAGALRQIVASQISALEQNAESITLLQGLIRGKLARDSIIATKGELASYAEDICQLQSMARAGALRQIIADQKAALAENVEAITLLQSLGRGMIVRRDIALDLDSLDRHTFITTKLQGFMRGFIYRRQQREFLDDLKSHTEQVTILQAHSRGALLRGEIADIIGQLEDEEEILVDFQARARAFIVRARFLEKQRFFKANMEKVIKIQSFVRGKIQGEAYKSLTHGKNPPVNAVKNFVHLLNDSDFDFNEEVEFERMRKTVVQKVRQNESLQQYIDQLDIKIALLVKNKITLDEVIRHQSNYGGHAMGMIANSTMASANQFDLKALNKNSRKKLELYQQLFFNLQTQPQYLARLFRRLRETGTAEKDSKRIEHLMMGLFGYAQKRREEYYLLKAVSRSMQEEVDACIGLPDFLRGNFFWTKLLGNYTRSPRDRKYLRDLLGPLIRENIIDDPGLDLESDPLQIYRSAIANEELRTGQPSFRHPDVPRDVAIKDPETRDLFIDHMRDLREICDQYLVALEEQLQRMPYGLRYMCRQSYQTLCGRFPREPQHIVLGAVANWLWKFYLQPAVISPETFGVIERTLGPLQKRNLSEVAKVLSQIAAGRLFGGENIYLQPLNEFIEDAINRLLAITDQLMAVPDAESTFDIDEFNDLYAKAKPTLYIKMADIFAIHGLVASELAAMCPNRDDVLREIMQELGSAKTNENEMTATGSSDIQMFLTPKLHNVDDPEAQVKTLFMETKRCVLYIIRVQQGANLMDILVKPITPEDEHKWCMLLEEDFSDASNTRGAYSDANMMDVTRMTYYDLKRTALENVVRLEQMGRISKHNHYQDILNAIALDIRTKSRRRVQRQRELEGVRMTLANLQQKAKYLEQQRKSYDDYIEQAMKTLQNKKGKKRFLLPFTKQYNHQRELERSGRVPKFGSYKYSVRQLNDKGVVVGWNGISDRDWDRINLTISCDEVGVFSFEGSRGHVQMPGASALVHIEDLLQAQFESHQFMNLFEGSLKLNVNLLLHLLYKKFYRTQ
ncbi:Ras GTPase-activating-like protein rng2 [Ceratocystis fimbriata CBS 114723]|uniref:Ras GTPase-activating-like protein rng2 n=1 Tax=Ceratocystis fimbriata CBS 114723 TaxID=1035309 RepID=A0A2C5WZM8_9PEZI|nr:Ras GTPase-activating-like protein rng2 [Ceratocystis fimbriata CBS 114723]